MLLLALALLFQQPDTVPTFDSPATRELVERVVAGSAQPPAELQDYEAQVQTSMYLSVAPDSTTGGDLPASVDELVSDVRWSRSGALQQTVAGHRTRMLVPVPYTLASILERPWVIPHLYGSDIYTPFAGPRAVNPFGARGPAYYRYTAEDTVRIRVQDETVTLVPVSVRPRAAGGVPGTLLVVGTFYLDPARAAVARARFGFAGKANDLSAALGRMETFLELDNALWEGRYWLPFQQRREVVFNSSLLGGTVAARIVNRFVGYRFNSGWTPTGPSVQLAWRLQPERVAFAGWRREVGEEAGQFSTRDFADLRLATSTAGAPEGGAPEPHLYYERGSDLFRYNRVEGAFLGVGGRLTPPDPRRERWSVYGTAGWAFAESTARGELRASVGSAAAPRPPGPLDRGATVAAYRRLNAILPFRPTFQWDWIYSFPALFWGSDSRDYYDATGVEAFGLVRRGRWDGRLGGRVEREDSVRVNTTHFLFGRSDHFGPLAGVRPGTHVGIEAGGGYALGPGAFGIGNSAIARVDAEAGVGDFHFQRVTALLSTRYRLGPFTLATRVDGGHAMGDVPPQKLFRFGSTEGLRGFEPNEFGGSTALLARGRLLLGLPPRSTQPLGRVGFFLIPPLRPSLVLVGESGWTRIDPSLRDELLLLRARPTDGALTSLGLGVSFFDDAFTVERLEPLGANPAERSGRWYVGLTYWY